MIETIDTALRLAQEGNVKGVRFIYEYTWKSVAIEDINGDGVPGRRICTAGGNVL